MTLMPGHLAEEQRKILRPVALAYRRVMRAPEEPVATRAEEARMTQKRQSEALAAATAEYRRLSLNQSRNARRSLRLRRAITRYRASNAASEQHHPGPGDHN